MMIRFCMLLVLTLTLSWAGGCATYVNIPGQDGDVAVGDPDNGSVRAVSIEAVNAVVARADRATTYRLILPAGSSGKTYVRVAQKIGPAVQISGENNINLPPLDVRQVFIRGTEAQVDIIEPAGEVGRQLVTVYLDWGLFRNWDARRVRVWTMDVEKALLASRPYGTITPTR